MITNNPHNDGRVLDITELPTDEYPILSDAVLEMVQEGAEPNDVAAAPARKKDEPLAVQSLTNLEAEVGRLHAKWLTIDAEFRNREAQIAQLNEDIKGRESAIAKLTADVERGAASLKAAEERLTGKDLEIAALVRDQRGRDERIESLSKELAEAGTKHKETLEKLALAETETTRLNGLVLREQAAVVNLTERNKKAQSEQEALQTKLQDLEIYINGRHDQWSGLNAELAALRDTLRAKEETIKNRDAAIAAHDEEKRQLTASIHDLERQCSELVGRRKEREEAYDELQKKLASHLAQTEQLKGEFAARSKETDQAVKRAEDGRLAIESLERAVKERDGSIQALNAEVEQGKVALGELSTANTELRKRIDGHAKEVAEHMEQIQALHEELRKTHDQLRLTQQQLADLTAQLTTNKDALERKSLEAQRLTQERDAAVKDSAGARAELQALGAHTNEIGKQRAEALAEARQLQAALAERDQMVSKLEAELRKKQAAADLLERNVGRITNLGASLAALDERMNGGAAKRDADPAGAHASDFVTTLAADNGSDSQGPRPQSGGELLHVDFDDGPRRGVIDASERTGVEAGRRFVVTIDGRSVDYPILKRQMTIGRGQDSDIRVASHFVSRVHARIRVNGAATVIEDAGSKNGVLVNSERVLRRVLRDGDIVTLGDDCNLRFVDTTH